MLVGSNVFFKDIEGFTSKDTDILELVGLIPQALRMSDNLSFQINVSFNGEKCLLMN